MVDVEGARYRKVIGPARFLHNNTYLICDTALWNVESQIIDAWGHVSILQEETVLTSDNLQYLIDADLAKFRGSVVQLTDKDHNTLRTRFLDYNTKDSVAVFLSGGAMRDKDGQIIESRTGTYDSKINTFTFENDVNMFTDSVFVKTRELVYESDLNLATFGSATDAWQDDNMLSANRGWYDRGRELFFFENNVHVMTVDQEGWCDSLFFNRLTSNVEMLGNSQVTDTTRNVFSLAGRIEYVDSLSKVTLTRKPAVISQNEEADGSIDTVYLGADKLVYYTLRKCDINPAAVSDAEKRLNAIREFAEFNSGMRIAMRDLEIRGAGNVLGAEQHGHMDRVGYELYSKLMKEELTGEREIPAELDIRVGAYITDKYIESSAGRLDAYKQIAEISTTADYERVYESLKETYGELPIAVVNLLVIAVLKSYAQKFSVKKITVAGGVGSLEFPSLEALGDKRLLAALDEHKKGVRLNMATSPVIEFFGRKDSVDLMAEMTKFLKFALTFTTL